MIFLVTYDISDDKIRRKVSSYLEDRGERIQKSVFVIEVKSKKIDRLKEELKNIQNGDGVIHLFTICHSCYKKAMVLGRNIPQQFYCFT